jgi:hypothetical protein
VGVRAARRACDRIGSTIVVTLPVVLQFVVARTPDSRECRAYYLMAHRSSHRKRMVEGPQLCHRMKAVEPEIVRGKPVKAGQSFSAAHIVGYFDTIEAMHQVYDRYKGHTALSVDASGWRLEK